MRQKEMQKNGDAASTPVKVAGAGSISGGIRIVDRCLQPEKIPFIHLQPSVISKNTQEPKPGGLLLPKVPATLTLSEWQDLARRLITQFIFQFELDGWKKALKVAQFDFEEFPVGTCAARQVQ